MKRVFSLQLIICLCTMLAAESVAAKTYRVTSPDGRLTASVTAGKTLMWELTHAGDTVLKPSAIALEAYSPDGNPIFDFGRNVKVRKAMRKTVNDSFATPFYRKSRVADHYNELTLICGGDMDLQIRMYNDAAAYRLLYKGGKPINITSETADFNFADDNICFLPYVNDNRGGERYCYSFESYYDEMPMSMMHTDSLAITPLMVCLPSGKKAVLMDAGVEDYPGMYLKVNPQNSTGLTAEFPPLPSGTEIGGFNRLNLMPTGRMDHIAEIPGSRSLPWRAVVVTESDCRLADCDIARRLAPACRIADTSWIKPGKVAWDWWNTCTLTGVDFKTGMNTPTYKAFIDFAAENGLEYIIIDEGWSGQESLVADLSEDIDLPEIIAYGHDRNVGVILWASWRNAARDTENDFRHYADMGIKGFKVDFIDRDDQAAVASLEKIAAIAAENHLLLDFHGMKPNGLHSAYPNILNYEGVKGLENAKWEPTGDDGPMHDFPRYDVTAPYLRMLAGPMDYTPGAMVNKTRHEFRAVNDHPMSMGTRVHQMAMYTVFDAPLQMLADSPSNYRNAQECTDFIAKVPTVFDETVPINGEIGEYITLARRHGDTWYVGSLTNWDERCLTLDLSFLGEGAFIADIFEDGTNADKEATDYRRTVTPIDSKSTLNIHLMPGGGWTARITPASR